MDFIARSIVLTNPLISREDAFLEVPEEDDYHSHTEVLKHHTTRLPYR
jgi:hypothetical protein